MMDYKKAYYALFNELTDVHRWVGAAKETSAVFLDCMKERIENAQQKVEEMYLSDDNEEKPAQENTD